MLTGWEQSDYRKYIDISTLCAIHRDFNNFCAGKRQTSLGGKIWVTENKKLQKEDKKFHKMKDSNTVVLHEVTRFPSII